MSPLLLLLLLSLQRVAEVSTSRRLRTCSALVVLGTATMTARAHGAVTARMATTERCRIRRLRPARVSAANHAIWADRANSANCNQANRVNIPPNILFCCNCCGEQTPGYYAVPVRCFSLFLILPLTHHSVGRPPAVAAFHGSTDSV